MSIGGRSDEARATAYAQAIIDIAQGEDALETVGDELLQVARAMSADDELHRVLGDEQVPLGRRLQAAEEVLGAAHGATRSAITVVISAGQLRRLDEIAHAVAEKAAGERDRTLAEVWVARPLDDDQRERLRSGLEEAVGKQLELQVYVDDSVLGGVRAKIDDTVIDGTLARRLDALKARVGA